MKWLWIVLLSSCLQSQNAVDDFLKPSDSLNNSRRNAVVLSQVALSAGTFFALNSLWYADYDKSDFHWINDNGEWKQMDKVGHAFTTYQLSRNTYDIYRWSGMSEKSSLLWAGLSSWTYVSAIEYFDGKSAKWGASATDLAANTAGSLLFVGQELLWKEQRIQLKYSFHTTPYAGARPDALGNGIGEQFIKDYNGQTYWLSVNVKSFLKSEKIPAWLNLAFGYGAEGMTTGEDYPLANSVFFPEKNRIRQYYFSLDADLTRIRTNSHLLKTVFSVVNTVKIPFPTLEINSRGKAIFKPIYF